jgi:hypothetical protein
MSQSPCCYRLNYIPGRILIDTFSVVSELAPVGGSRVLSRHSCQLPMTRVKNIIKSDPEISLTSTEATLIIAKVDLTTLSTEAQATSCLARPLYYH